MIFVIMLIAALIGGFMATSKGKNVFLWFVLCGLFPIAILFLAFMRSEAAVAPAPAHRHEALAAPSGSISAADEIRKLDELRASGVLTREEFDVKKKQILDRA